MLMFSNEDNTVRALIVSFLLNHFTVDHQYEQPDFYDFHGSPLPTLRDVQLQVVSYAASQSMLGDGHVFRDLPPAVAAEHASDYQCHFNISQVHYSTSSAAPSRVLAIRARSFGACLL